MINTEQTIPDYSPELSSSPSRYEATNKDGEFSLLLGKSPKTDSREFEDVQNKVQDNQNFDVSTKEMTPKKTPKDDPGREELKDIDQAEPEGILGRMISEKEPNNSGMKQNTDHPQVLPKPKLNILQQRFTKSGSDQPPKVVAAVTPDKPESAANPLEEKMNTEVDQKGSAPEKTEKKADRGDLLIESRLRGRAGKHATPAGPTNGKPKLVKLANATNGAGNTGKVLQTTSGKTGTGNQDSNQNLAGQQSPSNQFDPGGNENESAVKGSATFENTQVSTTPAENNNTVTATSSAGALRSQLSTPQGLAAQAVARWQSAAQRLISTITSMVQGTVTQTSARLDSGQLGAMELQLQQESNDQHLTIRVETDLVKQDLEKILPFIQDNLLSKGIQLNSLSVEVQSNNQQSKSHSEFSSSAKEAGTHGKDDENPNTNPQSDSQVRDYGYNTLELIA